MDVQVDLFICPCLSFTPRILFFQKGCRQTLTPLLSKEFSPLTLFFIENFSAEASTVSIFSREVNKADDMIKSVTVFVIF